MERRRPSRVDMRAQASRNNMYDDSGGSTRRHKKHNRPRTSNTRSWRPPVLSSSSTFAAFHSQEDDGGREECLYAQSPFCGSYRIPGVYPPSWEVSSVDHFPSFTEYPAPQEDEGERVEPSASSDDPGASAPPASSDDLGAFVANLEIHSDPIERADTPPSKNEQEEDTAVVMAASVEGEGDNECIVCMDAPIASNIALVSCGHVKMCKGCTDKIMANTKRCPLCRAPIVMTIKLHR